MVTSTVGINDEYVPRPLSLAWELLHLPALAVTFVVGYLNYDHMPDMVPTHMNAAGRIDDYTPKSMMLVWLPVVVQTIMAVCMAAAHWMVLRSLRSAAFGAPPSDPRVHGLFFRVWSLFVLIGGLTVSSALGVGMELVFTGLTDIGMFATTMLIVAFAALAGAVATGLLCRWNGWRPALSASLEERYPARGETMSDAGSLLSDDTTPATAPTPADDDAPPQEDDRYWKGGIIYWNPDDPEVFVPDRAGDGWTFNAARPSIWIFLVAIIVGPVALVWWGSAT